MKLDWTNQITSLMKRAEEVQGGWNGEDSKYIFEGEIYHEDDAGIAGDIAEKCKELLELLEEASL